MSEPKPNPFEDVERESAKAVDRHLAIAKALDGMEQDVNTWEAGFLQSVLDQLQIRRRPLSQTQFEKLLEMCRDYGIDPEDL